MSTSEVVSDTGPLISFEKLPNGFALLRRLCHQVLIPEQVLKELEAGLPGANYLQTYAIGDWVRVVREAPLWQGAGANDLDLGERAALGLARQLKVPLLIEERLGRRIASEAGIPFAGAAGLILQGYRRGDIAASTTRQALLGLRAAGRIGRFLVDELIARIDD